MNLKSSIVSGLFAATILVGGIATTGSAFAQSAGVAQSCVATRAPISHAQRQLTHAKSVNAMGNNCVAISNQASVSTQFPTHSLASDGTSHSSNNPNNNS